jgi:GT2 family glycosyltransferase
MISAVICHHTGSLVHAAVDSVKKSKAVDFEIVVMSSQDGLECPNADRVVFWPGGPAEKRNASLRWTIGDYIAFFDDDVVVDDHALFEMERALKSNQRIGMVFGKLLKMDDATTFDEAGSFLTPFGFLWARGDHVKDIGQFERPEPILAGKSASCMIRRKVFTNVGFFDPTYGILGEESDLAWRVWLSGKEVFWVPKSIALHAFNTPVKTADFYTAERVYYNGCRNYISMLLANLNVWHIICIVPAHALMWFLCGLGMCARGRFDEGRHIFRGLFYNIRN